MSYVYVIGGPPEQVKIGISVDPPARLATLQTGNGHKLSVVFLAKFEIPGRAIEKRVHELLSQYRMKGEWFWISPKRAVVTILTVKAELGIEMEILDDPYRLALDEADRPIVQPSPIRLKRYRRLALALAIGAAALAFPDLAARGAMLTLAVGLFVLGIAMQLGVTRLLWSSFWRGLGFGAGWRLANGRRGRRR